MKELTIEPTNQCDLNCLQCSTQACKTGGFWSLNDVNKYLDMFHDFDVVRVSGGEPFNHPKLEEILKAIKERDKKVVILTCGVDKGVIDLEQMKSVKPYVDEIVFSVHGFDSVHDSIVTSDSIPYRHPPYWDIMMDSADNASLVGIDVSFQTVLMQANFNHLDDLAHSMWCWINSTNKDLHWHLLRFVKQGKGRINASEALSVKQLDEVRKKIGIYISNSKFIYHWAGKKGNDFALYLSSHLKSSRSLIITYTKSIDSNRCDCGSRKAVVTYDHEIIPCSALKNKKADEYGNIACKGRI